MPKFVFNALLLAVVVCVVASFFFTNGTLLAKEDDLAVVSKQLEKLEANQLKIMESLELMKKELKIIKIRATG
ncbi:MAG: hypothetical protein ABIB11_01365 [Candidatus Omnitrophota bacterium]